MSERSLRILHVITKLDVGGAQSVVQELVVQQQRAGHSVQVVTGVVGPVSEALRSLGVVVTEVPDLRHRLAPVQDRKAVRVLTSLIRASRFNIVHTHSSKGGLLGRIAARCCGVPSVYSAHGWPFQTGAPIAQRVQSFAGEWVAGRIGTEVVCVTEVERQLAERLRVGRRGHVHLIHNGVADREPIRRKPREANEPLRLLMVARLSPPKRADLLVDALKLVDGNVHLTIVGHGELSSALAEQVERLAIADQVSLVGQADPAPFLAEADVFCLVSEYEGMPMTVLEAMRAGLPIIANRLPGIAEAIATDCGLLCSPDPADLARVIRSMLDDPMRTYEMGQRARSRWEANFTAATMAEKYELLYHDVCGPSRR